MVQNILHIVHKEIRGLHQAAYILALFTFGSQVLALVRDRLLAHQFGAGGELDLYYTAFRIPDVLYVIFASTLSVYVLIPFLTKETEKGTVRDAQYLLSQFFSLFFVVYGIVALLAMFFAPVLTAYLFPGFASQNETLSVLVQLLLLQPLLLGVSSLFGIVTQMEHRFILYAISPILYNIGIIFGLLVLYPVFGIYGLILGVLAGAFGHVCVQIPSVYKSTLAPRFVWKFVPSDIIEVCRTSVTRALTLSLHQLVLLGFVGMASVMSVGSVSVFQFAYNLQSVPLAIIGVSYSVAAFPFFAQLYAEKKYAQFSESILTTLRHIFFWSLPVVAFFVVIRAQFVRVVLGTGEFDWSDTRLTAAMLAIFILSLTAQAVHLLIVRALYAVGNTRIPFLVTVSSSCLAFGLALLFYSALQTEGVLYTSLSHIMRLEGISGIEVLSLPLGYSCALILHSIFLVVLSRKILFMQQVSIMSALLKSCVSALCAGYVSYIILNFVSMVFVVDTLLTVFLQGLLACLAGGVAYVCAQYACKNPELFEIYRTLQRRFSRQSVIVPQDEDTLSV